MAECFEYIAAFAGAQESGIEYPAPRPTSTKHAVMELKWESAEWRANTR
jgi:hypothetical protein